MTASDDKQLSKGSLYVAVGQGVFLLTSFVLYAILARLLDAGPLRPVPRGHDRPDLGRDHRQQRRAGRPAQVPARCLAVRPGGATGRRPRPGPDRRRRVPGLFPGRAAAGRPAARSGADRLPAGGLARHGRHERLRLLPGRFERQAGLSPVGLGRRRLRPDQAAGQQPAGLCRLGGERGAAGQRRLVAGRPGGSLPVEPTMAQAPPPLPRAEPAGSSASGRSWPLFCPPSA